jgi:ESS family glutamate:Na+ symporter
LTPSPEAAQECQDVGLSDAQKKEGIGHLDFLDAVLAIHICIIVGFLLNGFIADLGLRLPLFVTCLFAGILITNLVPKGLPSLTGTHWPARTPAMALIADIALGTFLAMSLMSMQLWTLIDLAAPILTILAAQFALAVIVTVFVLFPLMGRNYDAAVVAAGFGGVTLGSTPTAMANMAAVTQRFGPSHRAFIIVPLVSAFFIDLANAMAIPFFLRTF